MAYKGLDKQKHRRIMVELLVEIEKMIGDKLAFKGGTMAMLFYDLPRFSRDLDFDILKDITDEEKEKIKKMIHEQGRLKDFKDKNYTLFYLLSYDEGGSNIKLEFNRRVSKYNTYNIEHFYGVPIKITDQPTSFSHKLLALTQRNNPVSRDLFDVNFYLQQDFKLKEEIIKEKAGLKIEEYIPRAIDFIKDTFSKKNILHGLGELIDEDQKEWIKEELKEETIFLLKNYLKQI
ncbi:MAG: nucleotidyl transferase AbiEii/AbiGii toxin family protein [Candidatus Magasanikbacteria bacterium]